MTATIGHRIRKTRRRLGWTLQDLADRSGFTRSLMSKIENGRTVPPVATPPVGKQPDIAPPPAVTPPPDTPAAASDPFGDLGMPDADQLRLPGQ